MGVPGNRETIQDRRRKGLPDDGRRARRTPFRNTKPVFQKIVTKHQYINNFTILSRPLILYDSG